MRIRGFEDHNRLGSYEMVLAGEGNKAQPADTEKYVPHCERGAELIFRGKRGVQDQDSDPEVTTSRRLVTVVFRSAPYRFSARYGLTILLAVTMFAQRNYASSIVNYRIQPVS
jgi:hypothetical protein